MSPSSARKSHKGRALALDSRREVLGGEYPDIKARFFPVMCQQCGHAPCEPVCPFLRPIAVMKRSQRPGLQSMCGTRYCANNCPYIARVFNWFNPSFPDPLVEQLNPDVTVRSRG